MNKRIKELYERSFITDDYVNVGINGVELGIRFDPEKFAKFIVRECIDVLNPEGDLTSLREEFGRINAMNMIKKHFGVE